MTIQYGQFKYPVELIADYFIWKSNNENKSITNKKLQKLLYYAQAWNIVFNDVPMFLDDIEAWVHGPTVRKIYQNYSRFGFSPIKKEVDEKEFEGIEKTEDMKLLGDVWDVYGKFDADYLETLTHSEEPWQIAREGLEEDESSDIVIDLKDMREYYKSLLNT